jgi:uncharacterized protein YeaO (DUF488 family)
MRRLLRVKRAYDPPSEDDGWRILADRLRPRGVSKADAHIGLWLKDIAPSAESRRWFGHRSEHWSDFRNRYRQEPRSNPALPQPRVIIAATPVTSIQAAKAGDRDDAVVLFEVIDTEA